LEEIGRFKKFYLIIKMHFTDVAAGDIDSL
jgi:hypothetical protein